MKRCRHFALFIIVIGVLLAVGLRIEQVNQEVSIALSPTEVPGTYQLNNIPIPNEPWNVPTLGAGSATHESLSIDSVGAVSLKSFAQVSTEVEIPPDYRELDQRGTTIYAFLDISFSNNGTDEVSIPFPEFWLFADLVPGSYAAGLMKPYNPEKTSTLGAGQSETFTVVYRLLKSGFDTESWNNLNNLPFYFEIYSYPNKYVYDLAIDSASYSEEDPRA